MVVAEIYNKESGAFVCMIFCNDRMQMEFIIENMAFTFDVEMDAIDFGEQMVLQ